MHLDRPPYPYIINRLSGTGHFWTGDTWAVDIREARVYRDGPALERAKVEASDYEGNDVKELQATWL